MNHAREHKSETHTEAMKSTAAQKPKEEEIRFRAYEIYLSRNRTPGRAVDDWLRAEHELMSRN
jgi:hypothetical protein